MFLHQNDSFALFYVHEVFVYCSKLRCTQYSLLAFIIVFPHMLHILVQQRFYSSHKMTYIYETTFTNASIIILLFETFIKFSTSLITRTKTEKSLASLCCCLSGQNLCCLIIPLSHNTNTYFKDEFRVGKVVFIEFVQNFILYKQLRNDMVWC